MRKPHFACTTPFSGSYNLKFEMSVRDKEGLEGCLEGGGKEIRTVGEEGVGEGVGKGDEDGGREGGGEGVGKGDEDGGGHGGAG